MSRNGGIEVQSFAAARLRAARARLGTFSLPNSQPRQVISISPGVECHDLLRRGCFKFRWGEMWKMGRFCKFHHETVSSLGWLRWGFLAQIQETLLRRQLAEQVLLPNRSVQKRMSSQQHGCIGQQGHAPGQTQAVEEYLA